MVATTQVNFRTATVDAINNKERADRWQRLLDEIPALATTVREMSVGHDSTVQLGVVMLANLFTDGFIQRITMAYPAHLPALAATTANNLTQWLAGARDLLEAGDHVPAFPTPEAVEYAPQVRVVGELSSAFASSVYNVRPKPDGSIPAIQREIVCKLALKFNANYLNLDLEFQALVLDYLAWKFAMDKKPSLPEQAPRL